MKDSFQDFDFVEKCQINSTLTTKSDVH